MHTKRQYISKKILHILLVGTAISLVLAFVMSYIYKIEEDAAYETLHLETRHIKEDINLQIISDRENLTTIAKMIAKLYQNNESYNLMFEAFESIGLIQEIEILLPDNTLLTKTGSIDVRDDISFADEAKKDTHVTGKVSYLQNEKEDVVRSVVPVLVDDQTIAILYGVMDLDALENRYIDNIEKLGAQLFVFEQDSGELIIDTVNDDLGNISFLKDREYLKNFSYEKMITDIAADEPGYSAFVSTVFADDFYIHYAPMAVGEWEIILGLPGAVVFSNANYITNILLNVCATIILIMVAYIFLVLYDERQMTSMNNCVARIRKLLLEVNYREDSILTALGHIAKHVRSTSVFLRDTDGESYDYMTTGTEDFLKDKNEKNYFSSELFDYAKKLHPNHSVTIRATEIKSKKKNEDLSPLFCEFLVEHDIEKITLVSIVDKYEHFTLLGVINSKKKQLVTRLLAELAVCFSIALYNRSYLLKMECAVGTDSLTGVMNRVAYNRNVKQIRKRKPEQLACIYIDVNELHVFNNRFGHAAGDSMLIYVADTIKALFEEHSVYRMGGDEFLVVVEGLTSEDIQKRLDLLDEKLNEKKYYISVGFSINDGPLDWENLLKDAEKEMYKSKALYYLNKQKANVLELSTDSTRHIVTGMKELDTLLTIMGQKYLGVYSVSLRTDQSKRILMSGYLNHEETEENFSQIFKEYVNEQIHADYHREILNLLNYDILAERVLDGEIIKKVYQKNDGNMVVLNIYVVENTSHDVVETLWVFENN
ncbi:MAG: GGDEF domain-containing protein [Tyzzerella sp.]|nr:GGDEF domain-containing protein [Tyzzerella sp.]